MSDDILVRLQAAKSDEERSWIVQEASLANLDPATREAVWAAAVPHWFDVAFLASLLGKTAAEVEALWPRLVALSYVEPFPGRGFSVHERTRKLLLDVLWREEHGRFCELSRRAAVHCEGRDREEPSWQMEWIYHLLIAEPERGPTELRETGERWQKPPNLAFERVDALARLVSEHDDAGRLKDRSWLVARSQGEAEKLRDEIEFVLGGIKAAKWVEEPAALSGSGGDLPAPDPDGKKKKKKKKDKKKKKKRDRQRVRREIPAGVDPHDLAQTGWGVIFPRGRKKKLWRYLEPLLSLREDRAGDLFRHFTYKNEPASAFLRHEGETIGTIHPDKVPYYLLIVGGPEEIPFDFQYHLSFNHAVGRIHFSQPEDYVRYAQSVRAAETGKDLEVPRRAVLFSVESDDTLRLFARYLVELLRKSLGNYVPGWDVEVCRQERATKAHLRELLGRDSPGLLLVSCHGLRSEPFSEGQYERQGALICHRTSESDRDYVLTARDVPGTSLKGGIVCLFNDYGAGTPVLDNYPHEGRGGNAVLRSEPALLAERAFVARLPQVLLSRGALAVLGHVDRSWTLSFTWTHEDQKDRPRELGAADSFEDSLGLLLKGHRLGHALRPLHWRYAALAVRLVDALDAQRIGVAPDLAELGALWTAVHDARNFIVLGDPAVYLLGRRLENAMDEETSGGLA